ncbi:carbamoyl-phosphate synthase large subunit [Thermotoga sp. Ku-13t]|uniref:carbamoyl-phosphate synthase large subunit n=1 Tax=Thermotoga sp. Ku-13t TaxID=1755813 RepID=UPI0013EA4DD8|nr:carbamoyl-phosphate synthase large subunit [Thermotoga sp. Ku-13t]
MPKRQDIKKILLIGSGPITIGQAAEFDYSGTQALKALKSLGYHVIVVNSNSATIMTDPEFSDAVYIEPLEPDYLEKIIERERPDAILCTMGGQTALNLAVELHNRGILEKYNVQLIGAKLDTIKKAEDRELFKKAMKEAGLEVLRSETVSSPIDALRVAHEIGYPVVVRPSFTLGGSGGGIAYNDEELVSIVSRGLIESPERSVLIEESVVGWKEYELEVMRDCAKNFVVVCSIENFDPMGVHTGDSITVAPAQTLTDREYQAMRNAAMKAMDAIGMETGGCNIQFAVNPQDGRMVVIEINPRVSRSSALASKATGYPIAKVAAMLAVGLRLDEIANFITQKTSAAFEPSIDYVVVKIPRFQMEKFPGSDPRLGAQMKSVGEIMAIGRTFKEALGKALRSLELDKTPKLDLNHIKEYLANPTPERISYINAAFRQDFSVEEVHRLTKIDTWFLQEIKEIMDLEKQLKQIGPNDPNILRKAKEWGFSDRELAEIFEIPEKEVRSIRKSYGIRPVFKMVDTCAAEFEAATPYFYSTYNGIENEALPSERRKIAVLGSGPNRIGQGIEFDYANVHAVWAFQEEGYEAIMINSNPETVSTDYDTSDRLYFEPLTVEDVVEVAQNEKAETVVVSFGGQTPLKLAKELADEGLRILGTDFQQIDLAEDRARFAMFLKDLGLKMPDFRIVTSIEDALKAVDELGFPVLVRPSYVLGGRAMTIVDSKKELIEYVSQAALISQGHPLVLDKFLEDAIEMDVDVVSDGETVWIAGLMEQIEEAGIHSGDSACVLPPTSLSDELIDRIESLVFELVSGMKIVGPANVQLAIKNEEIYVIELNPRVSRTFPFVSKAIGIPVAKIAAKVLVGKKLVELLKPYFPYKTRKKVSENLEDFRGKLLPTPWPAYHSVKEVVIPFHKFSNVDALLGPEMKSTGEVMGIGRTFAEAFAKAQIAANGSFPKKAILVTVRDQDKREIVPLVSYLYDLGFEIYATNGTARILNAVGVPATAVPKFGETRPDVVDLIEQHKVDLVIITQSPEHREDTQLDPEAKAPLRFESRRSVGYKIRNAAIKNRIPYITTVEAFRAMVSAIRESRLKDFSVRSLKEWHRSNFPTMSSSSHADRAPIESVAGGLHG